MSLRGYWRTLIVRIACKPAIRITKLTTSASTGRLMKRSVKDFMSLRSLRINWVRIYLRVRCQIVVDRHRHSVSQFENPRTHDGFAGLQSLRNRDEIAAPFTDAHKLLSNHLRFFAGLFVFLFLNHKNRVPERRVGNCGSRNDKRLVL